MAKLNWDREKIEDRGRRQGNAYVKSRPFGKPKKKPKNTPPAPMCPKCKSPMVRRTSEFGPFWGCNQFPRCRGTRK